MVSGELSELEHQGGQEKFIQGERSWMCCSLLSWKALWCFRNEGGFLNTVLSKLCQTEFVPGMLYPL